MKTLVRVRLCFPSVITCVVLGCAASTQVTAAATETTSASSAPPSTFAILPDRPDSRSTPHSDGGETPPSHQVRETLDDGQIALIVSDVDIAELSAAELALSRAKKPRVRQFAQHVLSAHAALEHDLVTITKVEDIHPTDSVAAAKLTNDDRDREQAIMGQFDSDFDRAYIVAQILAGQNELGLIDDKLLPSVRNARLKTALELLRAKVVDHVMMAKEVRSSLGRS
jgi:putative membrane protein